MNGWQSFSTAPRDGRQFLAYQSGEIYVARYEQGYGRLCFRTHSLWVQSKYQVMNTELAGKPVRAQVPIEEPWHEEFQHTWTLWTKGFEFRPTLWAALDLPKQPTESAVG